MKTQCMLIIAGLFVTGMLANAQESTRGMKPSNGNEIEREMIKPRQISKILPAPSLQVPEMDSSSAEAPMPVRHLWGDVDADGLKDLFVLDMKGNLLFRNLGDGGFDDVTALAFPYGARKGVSGFFGDYNGDNRLDLFLFHAEGFTLFRNEGKLHFTDVTASLGLDAKIPPGGIRLEDYDKDGDGDLLVQTPEGDRIYRNREGREFVEVKVSLPERGRDSTPGIKTGHPGPVPPVKAPGGPAGSESDGEGTFSWDGIYINDNSPGSVGVGVPEVEGGDDSTTQNDIVDGTVAGADLKLPFDISGSETPGTMMQIINTATTGNSSGIKGESQSDEGKGVFGWASAASGSTYGVWGSAASDEGCGVWGYTPSPTGQTMGVWGRSDSTQGIGVKGNANATSGKTYGVVGSANSTGGIGVYGQALAASGTTYGVYGWVASPNGYAGYFEGITKVTGGPLEVDGLVESTSGGFKFPDGSIQTTAASGGGSFPPPAYNSGWQTVTPGYTLTLTHNLGGNVDNYVVDMQFKKPSGEVAGIHHIDYGGDTDQYGNRKGVDYRELNTSSIKIYRESNDSMAQYIRVRIWVYE